MRPVIAAAIVFGAGCFEPAGTDASLISESKNGAFQVTVLELTGMLDRNFQIWLQRRSDGFKINLFQSPDEGTPIGSERIIWSGDHSQFVLVGKEFFVEDGSRLPIEKLYLLYDIPTGKLWCNASQAPGPRFTKTNFFT